MIALAGELAEGTVGPRSFASWSMTEVEGIRSAIVAFEKNSRRLEDRVAGYLAAWPELYTVCDCMNKVVEEGGWDKLSGATLRDQFLELKAFSPQGMTRCMFAADKPAPTQTLMFKVERGRLLPITNWVTCPDLRSAALR